MIYKLRSVFLLKPARANDLTFIGKYWKNKPEFFPKFQLSGSWARPYHLKINQIFIKNLNFWVMNWTEKKSTNQTREHNISFDDFLSNLNDLRVNYNQYAMPQNSKIDVWMSFPVRRSGSLLGSTKTEKVLMIV